MNAAYKRPVIVEDDIDAALKMLGEMQPPAAIVSRVHSCLETAALSQTARSSRRWLLIPAAGLAMLTVVLVAIFVPTHRKQRHQTPAVETARLVSATPLVQAAVMSPCAMAATKSPRKGKRSVQLRVERRIHSNRGIRHATNLLSYPLTPQEKLLVRFVQAAKPADLQALNPEYQAKMEAQQDAEFAAYLKSGSSSDTESATQTTESTQE